MRVLSLMITGALALAACGERAETPAVETPVAAQTPVTPVAAEPADLSVEQMCREAARILYGQEGAAVRFDESDFSISWPAPVDGGRLTFACSFVGPQVSLSNGDQRQTVDISSPAVAPAQQEAS